MRRTIIYKGAEMPVKDAMRASGTAILPQTVYRRLDAGWPVERALALPVRPERRWDTIRPLHRAGRLDDAEPFDIA